MTKAILAGNGVALLSKDPIQKFAAEAVFDPPTTFSGAGSGSPGTVTVAAPTGVATGGTVNGNGSGSPGTVTMAVPTGVASNGNQKVILVGLAGQSNQLGLKAIPDRAGLDVDVAHIWQFAGNETDSSTYQTIISEITPFLHPHGVITATGTDRLGPGEYTTRQVLANNPGAEVVGVPVAVSGTSLVTGGFEWKPAATSGASGTLFNNYISQMNLAIAAAQVKWPGCTIELITSWMQGENEALNGITTAAYLAAFNDFVTYSTARITGGSGMRYVIGSMIPQKWDPGISSPNLGFIAINAAHVQASLTIPRVLYARSTVSTASSTDNLHFDPATFVRESGNSSGAALYDTVGPNLVAPVSSTITVEANRHINIALASDDIHSTFEIVPGTNSALFQLSDPYLTPRVQWAGGGTGPAVGTYQLKLRARDGSGNYGPTITKTVLVANEVSPATFFGNGERGGVYDWSVLSNLSQTIDGLTPVTAVGQSVRWVRDSSSNNNHAKTADNVVPAPTLQIDANGKYVLRFAGNAVLLAPTPFYFPGTSTAYTAIGGMKLSPQSAVHTMLSAGKSDNALPSLTPFQATTTASLQQSGRNNASAVGTFPVLPNIADGTARVVTSKFSSLGVQRMRDASLRPSDGSEVYGVTTSNTSIGLLIDSDRMGIGGNAAPTPGAFFVGDLYPFFVLSRDAQDWETVAGEDWAAQRALSASLPASFDGSAAGSVGTVAVSTPTGTASGGSTGSSSGNGAGSPGVVTLFSVGGNVVSSANASGSIGSVSLFPPVGSQTSILPVTIEEPLTLEDVKDYLGIFTNDKDYALSHMIPRARLWVEDYTGLAIAKRQFVERLRPTLNGVIRLSKGPLASVDSVTYLDSSGVAASLTPSFYPPIGTLTYANGWPHLNANDAFTVTYTAGADAEDIDDRLKGAMFALIEGEFSEGYAYPDRATQAAERCCLYLRQMVA
jgi:uncharacterized phiE125 gp8 family phage protein